MGNWLEPLRKLISQIKYKEVDLRQP